MHFDSRDDTARSVKSADTLKGRKRERERERERERKREEGLPTSGPRLNSRVQENLERVITTSWRKALVLLAPPFILIQ